MFPTSESLKNKTLVTGKEELWPFQNHFPEEPPVTYADEPFPEM